MRRRLWVSLLGVTIGSLILFVGILVSDSTPALGLDLQGGVSVILAPTESATGDDLITIRDLIREELESRGIAEPEVRVEGSNVVVELPGVKDQQEALDAVDIAGIVFLRPVLGCTGPLTPTDPDATTTTVAGGSTTTVAGGSTTTVAGGSTTTVAGGSTTTVAGGSTTTAAQPGGFRRAASPTTIPDGTDAPSTTSAPSTTVGSGSTTTTTVPGATTTTVPGATTTTVPTLTPGEAGQPSDPTQPAVLPVRGENAGFCSVGPSGGTGEVFSRGSAQAVIQEGGWGVVVNLTDAGESTWNALAADCFNTTETCPTGQLAIELDGEIQSNPVVRQPSFTDSVSITGDFSEGEARDLARVLRRGAFPVGVEAQTVQTISPTLGKDSLRAAIIAGVVGVFLVLAFLIAYYRRLAVVILGGIVVWWTLVYSVTALVSRSTNYTLSLAGITGIIIAIGVTVDSYIVFFERLKDEVRSGRTIRNAAPRSFANTWRTILTADLVSLLGSVILFWLSVGSVKGFALYLGLTTVCDLFVCYFFTRPAVILLSRTGWLAGPKALGLGATV